MKVELLYIEDCPNHGVFADRLSEALAATGHDDAEVRQVLVGSVNDAKRLGFIGSPSLRVDGYDPFASGSESVGISCRVYATESGLRGSPETAQLVSALTSLAVRR